MDVSQHPCTLSMSRMASNTSTLDMDRVAQKIVESPAERLTVTAVKNGHVDERTCTLGYIDCWGWPPPCHILCTSHDACHFPHNARLVRIVFPIEVVVLVN